MLNMGLFVGLILLMTIGFRLLFEKNFLTKLIGLSLVSHCTHLSLLFSGQTPPQEFLVGEASFLPSDSFETMLDPLPQALVLTAIVISFAVTGFLILYYLSTEAEDK